MVAVSSSPFVKMSGQAICVSCRRDISSIDSADGFANATRSVRLSSTSTTVGSASKPGSRPDSTSCASSDSASACPFLALMRFFNTILMSGRYARGSVQLRLALPQNVTVFDPTKKGRRRRPFMTDRSVGAYASPLFASEAQRHLERLQRVVQFELNRVRGHTHALQLAFL